MPGQFLPNPAPAFPGNVWIDPTITGISFAVGTPFPAVRYGELVESQGKYYVIEFGGVRLVPDDPTLASKGYSKDEATYLSSDDFRLFPTGSTYLPVKPMSQIVVRGDVRAETYLYSMSTGAGAAQVAQKQLLLGAETTYVFTAKFGIPLTVAQAEIDAVPFAPVARIENFYQKVVTVTKVECIKQAHRSFVGMGGGDDFEIRACVDSPENVGRFSGDAYNLLLLNKTHLNEGGHTDLTGNNALQTNIISSNALQLKQVGALGIYIHDVDDFCTQDSSGQSQPTNGFLVCPNSDVWFDTTLAGKGDQVLVFKAKTGGIGSEWTVEYHLTIHVDYAHFNGEFALIAEADYPKNIHRIKHFFVVMMENRSFDHLLGANAVLQQRLTALRSGDPTLPPPMPTLLTSPGADAAALKNWPPEGYDQPYAPAQDPVPVDLGHEISCTLAQLVGFDLVANQDAVGKNNKVLDPSGKLIAPILMNGFRDNYRSHDPPPNYTDAAQVVHDASDRTLGCMQPAIGQAYAVNELAEKFALCARWHASVPGPTWPNRFFLHCGTSGGISVSPDVLGGGDTTNEAALVSYVTGSGFDFDNKSIFDRLNGLGVPWRIYHCGLQTQVWAIQGMSPLWDAPAGIPLLFPTLEGVISTLFEEHLQDWGAMLFSGALTLAGLVAEVTTMVLEGFADPIVGIFELYELTREVVYLCERLSAIFGSGDFADHGGLQRDFDSHFKDDVSDPSYLPFYTFLEPNQDTNSGHPNQGEGASEAYIANVYAALRASPMWKNGECALIVLYDENGGFYDHVAPPSDPGYVTCDNKYRRFGDDVGAGWPEKYHDTFDFSLLGLRVPAIIISPYTFQGRAGAPPAMIGTVYEHSSVIKTLQRRLQDTNYLTPRVAFTRDLFDAFGTMPLIAGQPEAPLELAEYLLDTTVQTVNPSPWSLASLEYSVARAAEIEARCFRVIGRSSVPQIMSHAKQYATMKDRTAYIKTALDQEMVAHRAKIAATTQASTAAKYSYLSNASSTLEDYRKCVGQFRVGYATAHAKTSPKDKYAAMRSAGQNLPPKPQPTPAYADGVLLKGSSAAVYLMKSGHRRWISNPAAFNALHFDWAAILTIPDAALAAIPDGGPLTSFECKQILAFFLWCQRGRPVGDEWADWFAVEQQIRESAFQRWLARKQPRGDDWADWFAAEDSL